MEIRDAAMLSNPFKGLYLPQSIKAPAIWQWSDIKDSGKNSKICG